MKEPKCKKTTDGKHIWTEKYEYIVRSTYAHLKKFIPKCGACGILDTKNEYFG